MVALFFGAPKILAFRKSKLEDYNFIQPPCRNFMLNDLADLDGFYFQLTLKPGKSDYAVLIKYLPAQIT